MRSVFAKLARGLGFLATWTSLAGPVDARASTGLADPLVLEVPGYPDAFYYRPKAKTQRPILMYLHGRGGNPFEDCRKWAQVALQFGWVVCPQGPGGAGSARNWGGGVEASKKTIDATLAALRHKYKARVKPKGNILMGFSEGAFIAQQVGVHDPDQWSRWLILAANDQYWFGDAPRLLSENRKKIKRVFLFTGEWDQVAPNTVRAGDMLKRENIPVRVLLVPGMGHEVPADRMVTNYRRPLMWLAALK